MNSPQTLSEADRRVVAAWAADCAERVLGLFEAEAPEDGRPRDAIARARAFAGGELGVAEMIRRRFSGGGAARDVKAPAAADAARPRLLPPVGENPSGPLGPGLLASGLPGTIVRDLQAGLAGANHVLLDGPPSPTLTACAVTRPVSVSVGSTSGSGAGG